MHVELHDKDGRVEVAELNCEGRHEAIFQAKRLIEEIEEVDYPEDEDDEEPLPRTAEGDDAARAALAEELEVQAARLLPYLQGEDEG